MASGGEGTAEGVNAGKDGVIYFDDLTPPGKIFRYDPRTGKTEEVMSPSNMTNGMHVDRNGDLLLAQGLPGSQMLAKRNLATGQVTKLADAYEGKRLISPNDVTSDAKGRIYFTDGRFNQTAEPESPNAVYRLDPDGKLARLTTDVGRPNGIEVSPDGNRLYVAVTALAHLKPNPLNNGGDKFGITKGGIVAYDLNSDGEISNGRTFYRTDKAASDGTAMDVAGNLYTAANDRSNGAKEIVVIAPDGKVLQELPLPAEGLPVQLGFGRGEDGATLYLSTAAPWGLWKIKTNQKGFYQD
ncbi:SMP-30/gluconolactonase/LRE family protein [Roseiarcaceae bacterium H3SJ34-1]|uniref:SMP-30/gluconolactonase/LRE family protein n=1 Tax=Terripilifer ovatus TaxID=3032367 RepID=UPI003AB956E6|nr:SMP-30/gluconolactonase/LRE family protein [Roseiarcaceae bacterium H3SJ34-1]